MLNESMLSTQLLQVDDLIHTNEKYHYQAFGLTIQSSIFFPELPALKSDKINPDVVIQCTEHVQSEMDDALLSRPNWKAKENAFWLNIKDVATFMVTQGRLILVKPSQGSDIASIRLFILGSCMGALLMQRDYFVLHGNAIQIGQHCISIVGDSGAGKSTLCASFFKKGYPILADDVCAVDHDLLVLPSFPQIKLWKDSATYLNINTQNLRKIRPHTEKYALPLSTQYQKKALPLCAIYQLTPSAQPQQRTEMTEAIGVQKLKILHQHTYRRHYLKGLNKSKQHHQQLIRIAKKISFVEITRPQGTFHVDALIDLITNDLRSKGLM